MAPGHVLSWTLLGLAVAILAPPLQAADPLPPLSEESKLFRGDATHLNRFCNPFPGCQAPVLFSTATKQVFGLIVDSSDYRFVGSAGDLILVEEFLEGEELSVIALTDGEQVMLLPSSQDHKRLGEGDTGPNTGGMGAYAPVSIAGPALLDRALNDVLKPVLAKMAEAGTPYTGILYAGLMIDSSGEPRVLEFNCRFGDPEAQVVLPVLDTDLTEHMWRIAANEPWSPDDLRHAASRAAVTTVLASPGYPVAPVKGAAISIPEDLPSDTLLFHAGTSYDNDGVLRTAGGRVLCATGLGADVPEALARSQSLADAVRFEGKVFRRDIAWREVARAGAA